MMDVVFTGCTKEQCRFGGHTGDPNKLVIGKTYNVVAQEVHSWTTKYYLEGYEGSFNSVCFEPVRGGK